MKHTVFFKLLLLLFTVLLSCGRSQSDEDSSKICADKELHIDSKLKNKWSSSAQQRLSENSVLGRDESAYAFAYSDNTPIEGGVWPLPQKIHYGETNRTVHRDGVVFVFRGVRYTECDILKFAIDTYIKKWMFPLSSPGVYGDPLTVSIQLRGKCPDLNEFPQQDMNEEYYLQVPSSGDATLQADEVWGILRGLETLSQLIFRSNESFVMRTVNVHDWPEYSYRGLLIDTGRHYIRKNVLLRQIDLMAQNKMNVFHWHIVDMESFPYISKSFANLSMGAFTPKHVYTPDVVQEIIRYARLRGVRIIVEFDTPGHMRSWSGQTGLLVECRNSKNQIIPPALIDPTNEENFEFLKNFFTEILQTFPDKFIHLGGDEADLWINECWKNNPIIESFMKENGMNSTSDVTRYYSHRITAIIKELLAERNEINLNEAGENGRFIFWDEIFDKTLDKEAIVHLWQASSEDERKERTAKITSAGYNMILSSCWYLSNIVYGHDWMGLGDTHSFYTCDPRNFNGTEEQKQLVLGGEAAMWAEYVDGTNLESRTWPRASTVAERLWSSPKATANAVDAWPRLHEHRCRMIARGYRAQPAYGSDFCFAEFDDELP